MNINRDIKITHCDIRVNELEKVYTIIVRDKEQKSYDEIFTTLDKIKKVLFKEFEYIGDLKNPKGSLLEMSKSLRERYDSKSNSYPNHLNHQRKIVKLDLCITNFIDPPKALPNLNQDLIQTIFNLLTFETVNHFVFVNKDALKNANLNMHSRAKNINYINPDLEGSFALLNALFNETVLFCNMIGLEKKYIHYFANTKNIDPEKTLLNMKNLDNEEIFQIFAKDETYSEPLREIRTFLYRQDEKKIIHKSKTRPHSQNSLNAIWKAYVDFDRKPIVEILLKRGASCNVEGVYKEYPEYRMRIIHVAALKNDYKPLELFLKMGARTDLKASNGSLAIHFAAQAGYINCIKLLFKKEDINVKGSNGLTPLLLACNHYKKDVVEYLVNNGADLNFPSDKGNTPLHAAIMLKHVEIISLLLKNKANVNAINNMGSSPLHLAVGANWGNLIEHLLKNGANLDLLDNAGKKPFDLLRPSKPKSNNLGTGGGMVAMRY